MKFGCCIKRYYPSGILGYAPPFAEAIDVATIHAANMLENKRLGLAWGKY
jgi:hypothetical protein